MGLEAACTLRVGKKSSAGTAHLEGETLSFRGDFRLDVGFDQMRDVSVDGTALVVVTDDAKARFELGAPVSERWLRLIKEPKGLFEKLEVGADSRVAVVDVRDSLFVTALREHTAGVTEGRVPQGSPVIFFGAETPDALRKIQLLRARLVDTGALWVIRPKGSKVVTEADVLGALRAAGLVDTKVVAFSRTHTAHKAVIPVEQRGQPFRARPIVSLPPGAPPAGKSESAAPRRAAEAKAKAAKKKAGSRDRRG